MKQVLSLLLLVISATCFSQINFEPGYYIDNNGKRTEGLIKNIAWKNNPQEFEYKLGENDDIRIAKISDIKEFQVGAYKFVRYNVKIEHSSNNVQTMDKSRDIKWHDETLFLKVLVEGKAFLYQVEDNNVIKYFFSTGDHSMAEQLLYKQFIDDTKIHEINQYRQQLHNLMKDEIPMKTFERLKYKKEPLVELFNEYNSKNGAQATDFTEGQNKGEVNIKITPGIGLITMETSNAILSGTHLKIGNEIAFRIGLEIEYIMPFNNKKWSLFVDPNYQTVKGSTESGDDTMDVQYNFIELPMGGRHYFFLSQDSKIFINAAYVLDFSLGDSQVQFNKRDPLKISKTTHYAVGAGFSFNKFGVEARYNTNRKLLQNYQYWATDYSSLNIILGYRFL